MSQFPAFHRFGWLNWRSWRFLQLLLFMLAVLLLQPLYSTNPWLMLAMQVIVLNGMAVSLSAAGFAPRLQWGFFAAWVVNVLLDASAGLVVDASLAVMLLLSGRVLAMALLAVLIVATLRYVLRSRHVTLDSICAAAVAYLFIGLAFAAAYQGFIAFDARSFSIPSDMAMASHGEQRVAMIYYSYVTLATLGYGDIAPRLPFAQMLAVIEAIIGQFYIAVVIAWLVSIYAAGRNAGSHVEERNAE